MLGVWPEASLLNHSCAPNTVHLLVGGQLYVRAAQPVAEGQQLLACYLGQVHCMPPRTGALHATWGRHTACHLRHLSQLRLLGALGRVQQGSQG